MPELAEVEYYRRRWAPGINRRIEDVFVNPGKRVFRDCNPRSLKRQLKGRKLLGSETHGKQMLFSVEGDRWLGVHLGMAGRLEAHKGNYDREKHDHFVLSMERGVTLVFNDYRLFGRILFEQGESPSWWRDLPPSILSDAFTAELFNEVMARRGRAPIKAVLLMQEFFPGVGNWMADEILWRSRVHPASLAGRIGPKKRAAVFAILREVCEDAMRVIAPDWSDPPDDWLFNHRWKDGGHCPRTGKPLRRETIGGRTTCWSPSWQTYRAL